MLGSALFGALWALIPAYLQAKRGSHIVITTIMFNYIAASLMVFMLVNVLKPLGSMAPQTRHFRRRRRNCRSSAGMLELFGMSVRSSPLNISFLLALVDGVRRLAADLAHQARLRNAHLRLQPKAARYAGISETRITSSPC